MEVEDLDASRMAVLLTLDALPPAKQKTRLIFEKILFLLTKNLPDELKDLNATFEAYRFGPYNEYADELIDGLDAAGLVEDGVPTDEGAALARKVRDSGRGAQIAHELEGIVNATREMSTDDILYLVYSLYPDYAQSSEIRGRIRSYRLEHFSISVDELSEGEVMVVRSDKGSRLRVEKHGNRVLLGPAPD